MKAVGILAVLGAALLGAGALAQDNNQMANLSADHILAPEGRAADARHDINLVADRPVTVRLAVARLTGTVEGETVSLPDSVRIEPNCAGATAFPITVQPNRPCTIAVSVTGMRGPGRYNAKVSLFGANGARQDLTLEFAHRRSSWWAIGLVLAGLLTGFVVTSWRGGGRARTKTVIEIKDAIEALTLLDAGQPGKPQRMRRVIGRAREMEAAVIRGVPVEASELVELGARVHQYMSLLDIEAAGSTLSPDKRAELALVVEATIDKMMPAASGKLVAVPEADFDAVRKKLRELQTPPALAGATREDSALPTEELPLPVTARMTSAAARLAFAFMEWGVALVLMLVFAAVAMGTLYFGKSYWGSYVDLLAAFMIGFGAYAGAVASVDNFVQRARTAS